MFYLFSSPEAIANHLSQRLLQIMQEKPDAVLGLATGSTMEPVYAHLVELVRLQKPDLSGITTFNLDEYIGLPPSHPQSYNYYMHQHLFNPLGLNEEQINLPCGVCENQEQECQEYSERIKAAGGLDFQLLGIGTNGHIGFNEPYTPFDSLTHVIELSENTRLDNGRFFDNQDEVPTHAITMGIKDIMDAKEVVLVATGEHKAQVMADLFNSPVDEFMPASALKQHGNFCVYLDEAAAGLLPANVLKRI
ncbi:MAG: glucosamine-6-phosphate deaminase [Trichlorobacter sp.]|jgi:glucosamine-6-phosphate deaminase|nr:glucosamine-6-phosphate deaminase [Trichlorobacter sp.]